MKKKKMKSYYINVCSNLTTHLECNKIKTLEKNVLFQLRQTLIINQFSLNFCCSDNDFFFFFLIIEATGVLWFSSQENPVFR